MAKNQSSLSVMGQLFGGRVAAPVSESTEQAVLGFMEYAYSVTSQVNLHAMLEEIDRYYYIENNTSKLNAAAKVLNRLGDKTKLQDMNIPLIMTQVESAASYFEETFLTGYPIFGVAANERYQDEAMMLEALFAENANKTGWASNLQKSYREGIKYNLMAIKTGWCYKSVPALANDPTMPNAAKAVSTEWQGNELQYLSMYNVYPDVRVEPNKVHARGEFIYHNELITRIEFKQMIIEMQQRKVPLRNIRQALESRPDGSGKFAYYWPSVNRDIYQANQGGELNWAAWVTGKASNDLNYAATYNRTWLYARIIPSEFGYTNVQAKNTPQVWAFCIINGKHVVYAERLPNIHGYLPIIIGQPHDDGLRMQSKGIAASAMPFQDMASAMWNIHINAKRRMVTDRVLYDPSKVDSAQMNNPNPSAKIPIKPNAQGTPLNQVVYQFPYNDNTQNLIAEAQAVVSFANEMNGQNKATQGQFVKGNKTQFEYNDVMSNSTARNRQLALSVEENFHQPIKEILLTNTLQFQSPKDLQSRTLKDTIKFDPVSVRDAAIVFKVPDGLNPKEKIMNGDSWKAAMNTLATVPAIGQEYRTGDVFAYLVKQQGADISEFRKSPQQRTYEQALATWQQVAMAAAEKGQQFNQPQPKPQDYGLNPDGSIMQQGQ